MDHSQRGLLSQRQKRSPDLFGAAVSCEVLLCAARRSHSQLLCEGLEPVVGRGLGQTLGLRRLSLLGSFAEQRSENGQTADPACVSRYLLPTSQFLLKQRDRFHLSFKFLGLGSIPSDAPVSSILQAKRGSPRSLKPASPMITIILSHTRTLFFFLENSFKFLSF